MYFVYLFIFACVILMPELINAGTWFLSEDDVESLLIFALGTLGLMLYVSKEKAFFKVREEKVTLQKKTNIISKDLSESYSYIGEMNRKLDVIKEVIYELPKKITGQNKKQIDRYKPILDAAKIFARTEKGALCIVSIKDKVFIDSIGINSFREFTAPSLLATKKGFWVEERHIIVRSPQSAEGMYAFIILVKEANHTEDMELLQLLASQALLLAVVFNDKKR